MSNLTVVENPIIQDSLGYLRRKETKTDLFRFHSDRLCAVLLAYAFNTLLLQAEEIETPLAQTLHKSIKGSIVFLPIFRAGLSLLPEALRLLPTAKVGFAGLARDEKTAIAHQYYWKIPKLYSEDSLFILDPMLATGGSILHILQNLSETELTRITVVSVVAAPEGIGAIEGKFPLVNIITAALDKKLNDVKYIVPGLGDYGDRYFGTV